tara:strand:- start:112 stop:1131 length:1020 start_codon:yes stop_codon:yes gene_type:complete
MKLKYKYIVGTQWMFYELEMLPEYIESLKDTLTDIENTENICFDFNLNISEYFEKIDTSRTSKEELIDKFNTNIDKLEGLVTITKSIYDDNDKPRSMVDYRRDLNYNGCQNYDYVIWGESDAYPPKQIFEVLDMVKDYASSANIHRYITTFAVRKMWDESWKVIEHSDFENKPYHGMAEEPELCQTMPYSIRYTMSREEMHDINNKVEDVDLRLIDFPKFDGSFLCISSDVIKSGVNVPQSIMGHLVDDTSMMVMCQKILGKQYKQFVVKNILKVHNRNNPKKRTNALDYDGDNRLDDITNFRKGDWFYRMKKLVHFNLNNLFDSQERFNTIKDFEEAE